MGRSFISFAVGGLMLVAASCGGSDEPGAQTNTTIATAPTVATTEPGPSSTEPVATVPQSTIPESTIAPENVPEALKFEAPLVDGGEIDLATLAGRPVLLWFWAPF